MTYWCHIAYFEACCFLCASMWVMYVLVDKFSTGMCGLCLSWRVGFMPVIRFRGKVRYWVRFVLLGGFCVSGWVWNNHKSYACD